MLPEADPNNEDNEGAPARDTILAIKRTFQPSTIVSVLFLHLIL
jgi:hypothetical protein